MRRFGKDLPIAQGRHYFVADAGGCDSGALRPASRWRVASNLCGDRRDCPLSQCLRRGRAVVPEGASPERDGSDPDRAALPDRADRGIADLRGAYHWGGEEVQYRADAIGLTVRISRLSKQFAEEKNHL